MLETVRYISSGKFISRSKWQHPDRIIDSYEVIFVIKGEVYINCNDTEYALRENDMLLIKPKIHHFGYKESTDTSFYWMHWQSEVDLFPNEQYHRLDDRYSLSLLFNQLLNYSSREVFSEMLDYTARLILGEIQLSGAIDKESRLVNSIAEWIKSNRDVQIKTSDVSSHFGYNSDYLSRLFKRAYKKSLKEYIDETKINHIKDMILNTNANLTEVSSACGFNEYKYFLKFFKYHTKMTPTEFLNVYSRIHTNNK